jgi:RNA polymerase sigma-70 factor (ECF subfamily)
MDDGDKQIRDELVKLIPRLRQFALAMTGNRADGDDLAQETLERALRRLHQFQRDTRLDSWLFKIAQNAWIDQTRSRRSRSRVVEADPEADAPGVDGRTAVNAAITLSKALNALNDLPEEQRAVIVLVMVEGYSYREAGEILGVPEGTVTSRLSRARAALEIKVLGERASHAQR